MYIIQLKKNKRVTCCRSSGVEHSLGKGEAESSNLSGSTSEDWHEKCSSPSMRKLLKVLSLFFIASCSSNNLDNDLNRLFSEDYYLGTPGSKLFYRTTTKETQEKYHYSECQKKIVNGDQLRIESCVSSYWLKAKSL